MGYGGIGNSESKTSQKTFTVNNAIAVSDQGAVQANRNSYNNTNVGNVQVKKGGVYTVTSNNSGLDETTFNQLRGLIGGQGAAAVPEPMDGGVGRALTDRINDQVTNGPEDAAKAKTNYILYGAIFLIVVLALGIGFKRKK